MANRIRKITAVRYTPAVPAVPGNPAYCIDTPHYVSADDYRKQYNNALFLSEKMGLPYGQIDPRVYKSVMGGPGVGGGTVLAYYTRKCFKASGGRPAIPASTTYATIAGWNSGAISNPRLIGHGYVTFRFAPYAIGAVAGLNPRADTASVVDSTHAFALLYGTVAIWESGVQITTLPGVAADSVFQIRRSKAGVVTYAANDEVVYTSLVPSTAPARLDVSLYMSGDYVDDPGVFSILEGSALGYVGTTSVFNADTRVVGRVGTTGFAWGYKGNNRYGAARGVVGTLGLVDGRVDYNGEAAVSVGTNGSARAAEDVSRSETLAFVGTSTDRANYSSSAGVYRGIFESYCIGGVPEVSVAYSDGISPSPVGFSLAPSGEVFTGVGVMRGHVGVSADRTPYSFSAGVMSGAYRGYSHDVSEAPDTAEMLETLLLTSTMTPFSDIVATFVSSVDVGDDLILTIEIESGLEWFDMLLTNSTVSGISDIDAAWADAIGVSSQTANGRVGVQYATNMNTNAITRYDGFDFLRILDTPSGAFGLRADGVYRIGGADDNGQPRDGFVDLGANTFGSGLQKHLDTVFFGLTTDGTPLAVIAGDDGVKRAYTIIKRAEFMRADVGKARLAKRWSLRLEVYEATQAELDAVEMVVHKTTRRWVK